MRPRAAALLLVVLPGLAGCAATAPDGGATAAPTVTATAAASPTGTPTSATPAPSPPPVPAPTRSPAREPEPTPPSTTTTPTSGLPRSLLGTDWTHIPTDEPVVALTFDGGGDAAGLPAIVATLERTGTPATFFLTGSWIRAHPAGARRLAGLGLPLGNHTDTHPHVPALTNREIASQLERAEQALVRATGRRFDPLVRFPFGDTTPADLRVVNDLGYVSVRWTVDTLGWQGTSAGRTARQVTDRVVQAAEPGAIILMHLGAHPTDGSTLDADALPSIISELRERDYRFVTLQALLDA